MVRRLLSATLVLTLAACELPQRLPPPQLAYAAPPLAVPLAERLAEDERRIAEGANFGQFTPGEYNELQGRHAAIEATRREQLAAGGGRFLPGQYEQLVAREEALSRTIFDYRHNGATPTAH